MFATPLTTASVATALAQAGTPSFGGDGDASITEAEIIAALAAASARTASMFGFGLLENIDPFTQPPLLLSGQTDKASRQAAVARHRTALEAFSCVAGEVADAIDMANSAPAQTTTIDTAFQALIHDAVDGIIDGQDAAGAIAAYGPNGAAAAVTALASDPSDCVIPNDPDNRPVSQTKDILVGEITATGNAKAITNAVAGTDIRTSPGRVYSDIDGNGQVDTSDPDIDGDGIANADDEAPLVAAPGSPAPNAPPAAKADSATVNEDDNVEIDVLANDSDIDGSLQPATVTVTRAPANGSTSTGAITYTPAANFSGADSFSSTVDDDAGDEGDNSAAEAGAVYLY